MKTITTTDFSKFGYRERKLAERLLQSWNENGLPEDFSDDEVTIMMNTHSGNVFLTNSDYQVAMMNGENLESFYTDPETGEEGFKEDLSIKSLINLRLVKPDEIPALASSVVDGTAYNRYDRKIMELLLLAWNEDQLPEKFSRENIRIAKDKYGSLFLTNAENQVAKLDGYDVKLCHINPETGEIDFIED